ncbi:hypothetical protein C942_00203 [Photobacterium marinum]|uniref:Uncharacterized protein n=1 Tax=Photobacterium marinum TaxID=1056511 RepID=L8JGF1_9GAMM|nr:hypothetical protein C942_00203 [Photobacterium marinum]
MKESSNRKAHRIMEMDYISSGDVWLDLVDIIGNYRQKTVA